MVRVMFYTGISMLLVSAALLFLPACFSYILVAVLLTLLTVLIIFKNKIKINGLKILVSLTLIFTVLGLYTLEYKAEPLKGLDGKTAIVEGTVSDWPTYNEDYTTYVINADKVSLTNEVGEIYGEIKDIKIRVSDINKSNLDVFEKSRFNIEFTDITPYKSSSYASGVYASGFMVEKAEKIGFDRPFYAVFYDIRYHVNRLLFDNISFEEATLSTAVLMGDFELLIPAFYSNSKATGVTHLLVVSGSHLGIIFQILGAVLYFLKAPKRVTALVLMFAIFSVSAICGFVPSILRAGLTYFILALGIFFFQKPDPLNSLGIAATVVCLISPFSAGNIAFLLSFMSTFGLIFICPIMYTKCERVINNHFKGSKLLKGGAIAACQTISATICTMPISVLVFGYLSIVSVLVNVLVGYAMSLVLILTLIVVILLWLPIRINALNSLLISALCLIIRYVVFVVNYFASFEYAVVTTNNLFLIPWALLFIGLILAVIKNSDEVKLITKKVMKTISITFVSVSIVMFSILLIPKSQSRIDVLSVGNGNAAIVTIDDKTIMIGSGDGKNDAEKIKNTMLRLGKTKLDMIILPTLDKDFAGGTAAVLEYYPNTDICLPTSGDFADELEYVKSGEYLYFENEAELVLLENYDLLIYKDKGVIINSEEESFVFCCGNFLFDIDDGVKHDDFSLICCNSLPKDLGNYIPNRILFSGSEKVYENAGDIRAENVFKRPVYYKTH